MDPLTITAAAGMRTRLEALDLIANNLANSSTPGFKADREAYNLYISAESIESATEATGTAQPLVPYIEQNRTDFSQGQLTPTSVPTDLALSGRGFFEVDGPNGTLLTRNGKLHITSEGRLTTSEGYEFATVEPRRIRMNPELPFIVDPDGTIRQEGAPLGQLKVVEPTNGNLQPAKQGGSYFSMDTRELGALVRSRAGVHQGKLEASNFSPAEAAVKLVNVLRQFETLQRALQMGAEMGRKAVEEVARVNP